MHVHRISALFIKFITSWISFTPMTIWLTAVSFCDNIYLFHELVLLTSHQRLVHNTPIITPLVLKNFNGMYMSRKTITFDSRRCWRRASWEQYLTGEWLKLEVWKLRNRKLACTKINFSYIRLWQLWVSETVTVRCLFYQPKSCVWDDEERKYENFIFTTTKTRAARATIICPN